MAATYQSRNKGTAGVSRLSSSRCLCRFCCCSSSASYGWVTSSLGSRRSSSKRGTKASAQRFEDKAKRPLIFPKLTSQAPNPFYSAEDDYASDTVTKQVRVSRVYDHFATPKAKFTVLAGSWDHRALPFDEFPNIEKMAEVSLMGFGGDRWGSSASSTGFLTRCPAWGISWLAS